ncbi:MAG: hypothetical protein R3F48_10890 [Candidatus Zixiibacteriota bacterium]
MYKIVINFLFILLFLLVIGISSALQAGTEINVTRVNFVDYDGDGFDDLAADNNENGIPDYIEEKKSEPIVEVQSVLGDSFGDQASQEGDIYLDNQEAFGARDFAIRCMSSRRIGLNAGEEFGAGNGLGVGGSGGGCQGGVCR